MLRRLVLASAVVLTVSAGVALGQAPATPPAATPGSPAPVTRPPLGRAGHIRATTVGANLDLGGGRSRLSVDHLARRAGASQAGVRTVITQAEVRF